MIRQHHKISTSNSDVSYLVKRAYASVLEIIDPVFKNAGLTRVQYQILAALRDGSAAYPTDLCVLLCYNIGALTRVVDQLVNRGLVARARRHHDRRKVELALTPTGHQTIVALIPQVVHKASLLVKFSATAQTTIANLTAVHKSTLIVHLS
jgi:DNA-binding MarR family transcriptional regulator